MATVWNHVDDRLPDDSNQKLCVTDMNIYGLASYQASPGIWVTRLGNQIVPSVPVRLWCDIEPVPEDLGRRL